MNNPFELPFRPGLGRVEVMEEASRLDMINNMNRDQLNQVLTLDVQSRVKAAARRRLKSFDIWGYGKIVVQFQHGPEQTFHKQGTAAAVRRWAMMKSLAIRVVEISDPYTREEWLRAFGDGKSRM